MTTPTFTIQDPDENGHIFIVNEDTGINLGPAEQVEEAFSQWLGKRDYQERGNG